MIDLSGHLGAWVGSWQTYLEPGALYDDSPARADVTRVGSDYAIRYEGEIRGDAVTGRMRVADGRIEWVDSWHTLGSHEVLITDGDGPPSYDYEGDGATWTWDVTIVPGHERLEITHHNAGPGVDRYVGVLMALERP